MRDQQPCRQRPRPPADSSEDQENSRGDGSTHRKTRRCQEESDQRHEPPLRRRSPDLRLRPGRPCRERDAAGRRQPAQRSDPWRRPSHPFMVVVYAANVTTRGPSRTLAVSPMSCPIRGVDPVMSQRVADALADVVRNDGVGQTWPSHHGAHHASHQSIRTERKEFAGRRCIRSSRGQRPEGGLATAALRAACPRPPIVQRTQISVDPPMMTLARRAPICARATRMDVNVRVQSRAAAPAPERAAATTPVSRRCAIRSSIKDEVRARPEGEGGGGRSYERGHEC